MDQFISDIINSGQVNFVLIAPVLFVFIGAILVFVFGFKKPVEPQFKKLASVDNSKKVKRKEKSQKLTTQNGNLVTSHEKQNEIKKKEVQQQEKSQQKSVTMTKKDKLSTKKDTSSPKKAENKKITSSSTKKQTPKKEKLQSKENDTEIESGTGGGGGEWMTVTKDRKKKIEELPVISEISGKKSEKGSPNQGKKKESQKQSKDEITTTKSNKKDSTENVESINDTKKVEVIEEKTSPSLPHIVEEISASKIEKQEIKVDAQVTSGNNIVFDELGDTWTEAKAPRKNKKKSRKE